MKAVLFFLALLLLTADIPFLPEALAEEEIYFKKAEDHQAMIPVKRVRRIKIPKGHHEGLLIDGNSIWMNNGLGAKTWIIDLASEDIVSEITPVATFTEGITPAPGGGYWVTDWDTAKLYLVEIRDKKMEAVSEKSFAPSLPAGVIWNGSRLYVVTWTRGAGTKYHLIEMDKDGNVVRKARIKGIPEPSQLAWDGTHLWITSWFNGRVYKVDVENFEIKGYFRSNIKKLSGIAWDGRSFWLTSTKADLYQVEITSSLSRGPLRSSQ
ncbi:YncE family protein [Candidatus Omnitrophota bacterium]